MAMELYDLQVSTSNIHNKLNELGNSLQKETKQNRIEEIVKMMEDPSFWLDRHLSSSLIKEMNNLKNILETFTKLINWSKTILDSIEELRKEYDLEIHELLESEYLDFKKEVDTFEIQLLLKEPYDSNNAILEFHPGAGGVDSQDWAEMLFRMYVRYAERNNFKLEVFIGGGYSFRKSDSIACAYIPTVDGIFIPGHQVVVEFGSIHQLGTYIADFYDECLKLYYQPKSVANWFTTEILARIKGGNKLDITKDNLVWIIKSVDEKKIQRNSAGISAGDV